MVSYDLKKSIWEIVCFDFADTGGCLSYDSHQMVVIIPPAFYLPLHYWKNNICAFLFMYSICLHLSLPMVFDFAVPHSSLFLEISTQSNKWQHHQLSFTLKSLYPLLQPSHISLALDHAKLSIHFLSPGMVQVKATHSHLKNSLCSTVKNDKLLQCQRSWLNARSLFCRANAHTGDHASRQLLPTR